MMGYRKISLALAGLWLAVAAAAAQPPADKPADQPGKGRPPARLIFDAEAGREVPVYRLPDDEQVPSGRVRVAADGVDWGVLKLNVPEAHKTTRGKGVKVAVLDTGCDYSHPDFGGVPQERMKSFVPAQGPYDVHGHGTHCAGRVLARGVNYGVAPDAELWVGKVLDNQGSGAVTWIARGVDWAAQNGIDVVSLSVGGNAADSYIPEAFARAEAAGVMLAVAAGNDGPNPDTVDYPGAYKQALAVAAIDKSLNVARFSSRGPNVFAAMPGVAIVSQFPGNRQAPMDGTSMGTPHLAGLMALWIAANPGVPKKDRPAAFRLAYAAAATDLGRPGRDTEYGYGFVDAAKLVGAAAPPPPPPVGGAITFTPGDFTPSGLEKLRQLNPKLDGLTFPLKP